MISVRRSVSGSAAVVVLIAVLALAMLPLRHHLEIATPALVLILPVVVGGIYGGIVAGFMAAVVGSLAFDFFFIPPYNTLWVNSPEYWVTLAVYLIVMAIVVRLVDVLEKMRAEAMARGDEARRLFELSELLVEESTVSELVGTVVSTVQSVFGTRGVALLLADEDRLEVAAAAGDPFTEEELASLQSSGASPVEVGTAAHAGSAPRAVALSTPGRPIGLLALHDGPGVGRDPDLLRTFANHLALALERAQLRQTVLHVELLEEVDKLRRSLVGAVSHDLRTPLSTIKFAVSSLRSPDAKVSDPERSELLGLVESEADRLDRLVTNLLDMTRIQAGALEPRYQSVSLRAVLDDAVVALGANGPAELDVSIAEDLPLVGADRTLVVQALANLLENAARFAPDGTPVTVTASETDRSVRVAVRDSGPGVPVADHEGIFEMFTRRDAGGRAGLGLAIAKAFVEAHGGKIWLEDSPSGGACFAFELPLSRSLATAS